MGKDKDFKLKCPFCTVPSTDFDIILFYNLNTLAQIKVTCRFVDTCLNTSYSFKIQVNQLKLRLYQGNQNLTPLGKTTKLRIRRQLINERLLIFVPQLVSSI